MKLRPAYLGSALLLQVIISSQLSAKGSHQKTPGGTGNSAKNVIYFIGDGMGISAMTAGRIWAQGSEGKLNLEELSHTGFSRTYSASDYVTDSAASGTALASGVKTYNGAIGLTDPVTDPSKKSRKLQTLADLAKAQGKSVGIISTARVTHATPACFYSHAPSREMEKKIASQISADHVDLLLGGGRESFLPGKDDTNRENIIEKLKSEGWQYAANRTELEKISVMSTKPVLGLFAMDHLAYDLERSVASPQEPDLLQLTDFAIRYLSKNPKGFFLMIEGGRIDHAAHNNDARNLVGDMVAFDSAIGKARQMTDSGDSLIVVTADHETGGLALNGYSSRVRSRGDAFLGVIPVVPGEENHFHMTFASGPHGIHKDTKSAATKQGSPALYYREAAAHTAVDVPVVAGGAGAELFTGFMSNEEIPWKIAEAMGTAFTDPVNISLHLRLEKVKTSS